MNWLDIVILAIIFVSGFLGFTKGLVRSFFSLLGLTLGVKLASMYYFEVGQMLTFIPNETGMKAAGFIIILFAVMLVAWIAGGLLRKIISLFGLKLVDHLGGAVLGLALGILSNTIILALLLTIPFSALRKFILTSGVASFLVEKLASLFPFLPDNINTFLHLFLFMR